MKFLSPPPHSPIISYFSCGCDKACVNSKLKRRRVFAMLHNLEVYSLGREGLTWRRSMDQLIRFIQSGSRRWRSSVQPAFSISINSGPPPMEYCYPHERWVFLSRNTLKNTPSTDTPGCLFLWLFYLQSSCRGRLIITILVLVSLPHKHITLNQIFHSWPLMPRFYHIIQTGFSPTLKSLYSVTVSTLFWDTI